MRVVPVNAVKGEAYLAADLHNDNGNVLLKKGVLLTAPLLQKIQENNIFTIYIMDKYSDVEIEDVIRPELRRRAVTTIMETFRSIEKSNREQRDEPGDLRKNLVIRQMDRYITDLRSIAQGIIDDLTSNPNLLINLVDIKNIDTYTYDHSVNVAVLSLIIGLESKISRLELQPLFMAGLLHDIGKTMISKDILNKNGTLNDMEMEIMKEHCELGYKYVRENFSFPILVTNAIHQHHERLDGTGYPKKIFGNLVSKYARIIAIADTYDAMISDTPYSKPVAPNEALEFIMGGAGSFFDYDLVSIFSRKVIPFPEGTLVKLSGDMIGVVKKTNNNYPLRPVVEIINHSSPNCGKIYDLLVTMDIVIEGVQYEDPNAEIDSTANV